MPAPPSTPVAVSGAAGAATGFDYSQLAGLPPEEAVRRLQAVQAGDAIREQVVPIYATIAGLLPASPNMAAIVITPDGKALGISEEELEAVQDTPLCDCDDDRGQSCNTCREDADDDQDDLDDDDLDDDDLDDDDQEDSWSQVKQQLETYRLNNDLSYNGLANLMRSARWSVTAASVTNWLKHDKSPRDASVAQVVKFLASAKARRYAEKIAKTKGK